MNYPSGIHTSCLMTAADVFSISLNFGLETLPRFLHQEGQVMINMEIMRKDWNTKPEHDLTPFLKRHRVSAEHAIYGLI